MCTEVDKKKMARNEWYKISETVMRALSEIAMDNPAITPEQQERWLHSATHNEVLLKMIREYFYSLIFYSYVATLQNRKMRETKW